MLLLCNGWEGGRKGAKSKSRQSVSKMFTLPAPKPQTGRRARRDRGCRARAGGEAGSVRFFCEEKNSFVMTLEK